MTNPIAIYDAGHVHMAVVPEEQLTCYYCDFPVDEPQDLLTVIDWHANPKLVLCENCVEHALVMEQKWL